MKKYSLLIVLGCLEGSLFASEAFKYVPLQESMPAEPSRKQEIGRSFARLNAFLQSLEVCKTALDMVTFDDISPEILTEFQGYIDGIIAHIDSIQGKVTSIMPYLQQAEHMGNPETGDCFESISFDTLLDGFIRIENAALQWLKNRKSSLNEESYGYVKRILKVSMAAALSLKFVTIVGEEVGIFSCDSCCEIL
jgi:hypothetical protein